MFPPAFAVVVFQCWMLTNSLIHAKKDQDICNTNITGDYPVNETTPCSNLNCSFRIVNSSSCTGEIRDRSLEGKDKNISSLCVAFFNDDSNKKCYVPAPVITSIEPNTTLISGGTNVTVTVKNLTQCFIPTLHIQEKHALKDCNLTTLTTISCKAPDMTSKFNETTTTNLSFSAKGKCIEKHLFTVKENPIFDEKMFTVSRMKNILIIEGKNIPKELETEIIISIGGTNCKVVSVSKHRVVCNANEFVKKIIEKYTIGTGNTSTIGNETTTPSSQKSASSKNIAGIIGVSVSASITSTPSAPPKEENNATVTIKIGHFSQEIGFLNVDLYEPDNDFNDKHLFIGVATFISLMVTGIILVMIIVVKLKNMKRDLGLELLSLESILNSIDDKTKKKNLDKLILSPKDVVLGNLIGSGNFGCVYDGVLCKDQLKVAVKTMQDSQSMQLKEFVHEALIMKDFDHRNVLKLIGLTEKEPGVPYVILPFMDKGDLLTYVRNESLEISLHDVIKFGADISNGMAYLSSLKFVHRDLAARNCMLDSSLTVKVADFGLCREIYEKGYYSSDNKKVLPVRWMAIECINNGSYTTKSDVWSLGVVLWELLTRGMTPYPGVDGWDIINYLRHRRLAMPFFCPDRLYYLMMLCWAKDPEVRPSFSMIEKELLRMIREESSQFLQCSTQQSIGDVPDSYDSGEVLQTYNHTITNNDKETQSSRCNIKSFNVTPDIEMSELSDKTIMEGNYVKLSQVSSPEVGIEQHENHYINILSLKYKGTVHNVDITQPTCYSDKEVSREEAGIYVHLVDHYQTIPHFKRIEMSHDEESTECDNRHEYHTRCAEDERFLSALTNGQSYFELETSRRSSVSTDEEMIEVQLQII